jgi:5-methyltetrahydrofolate--homocysteine methyltransferase
VPDASRAVGVATALVSDEQKAKFVTETRADYARVREAHAGKAQVKLLPIAAARANRVPIDWAAYTPLKPHVLGLQVLRDYPLADLVPFIDWGPFFQTWDLHGRYPAILDDATVGEAARSVFSEGQAMLEKIVRERWLTASAAFGLWPAAGVGDDIVLYTDASRTAVAMTWHNLRQQSEKPRGNANQCLSDFVAPAGDHVGGFVVTAGLGADSRAKAFEAAHDDYSAIMVKALADRLAEAFAEHLHWRVRREFWGYAADEALSNEQLIAEKYQGIRPAPGYPACPDHAPKGPLFELLQAEANAGVRLTERFAMWPAASVCGFYLAHPQARYFAVGKVGEDQLQDLAERRGETVEEVMRWVAG